MIPKQYQADMLMHLYVEAANPDALTRSQLSQVLQHLTEYIVNWVLMAAILEHRGWTVSGMAAS